jgi:GTPase
MSEEQKTIVAAIIGQPNAGKSTLLNAIAGQKVSIVSPKAQTTRQNVSGIIMNGNTQIVLVDTPGIFKPQKNMDREMVRAAWGALRGVDMILLLIDATRRNASQIPEILIKGVKERPVPVALVLNKIDLIKDKTKLLPVIESAREQMEFDDIFMISSTKRDGIKQLIDKLMKKAVVQEWMFPPDMISDMPEKVFAAEITREKIMLRLHQEIPYKVSVETESWVEKEGEPLELHQVIYVVSDGHKKIVLGKNGAQIKEIGTESRTSLQKIWGKKLRLFLHVKVAPDKVSLTQG